MSPPTSPSVSTGRTSASSSASSAAPWADADAVLSRDRSTLGPNQNARALFRSASALYALQLWPEAKARFEELAALDLVEGRKSVQRTIQRFREASNGHSDFMALYEQSQTTDRLDAADYVSPSIAVAETDSMRGRGLVTPKAVKAGELLFLSRPIADVYEDEVRTDKNVLSMNLSIKTSEMSGLAQLTQALLLK